MFYLLLILLLFLVLSHLREEFGELFVEELLFSIGFTVIPEV